MEVKQSQSGNKGIFFIGDDETKQAFMSYTVLNAGTFSIDHTVVNPGNEGKGLGKILVKAAVDHARANFLKIVPVCPYANSVFEKTPEYSDVWLKQPD